MSLRDRQVGTTLGEVNPSSRARSLRSYATRTPWVRVLPDGESRKHEGGCVSPEGLLSGGPGFLLTVSVTNPNNYRNHCNPSQEVDEPWTEESS